MAPKPLLKVHVPEPERDLLTQLARLGDRTLSATVRQLIRTRAAEVGLTVPDPLQPARARKSRP